LGGGEVNLLDHVDAYGTFATGGIHHDIVSILKIQDSKGNILEQYQPNDGERVVDEKYIAMIDYIMSTNSLRAPIFGNNNPLSFPDRPVAAKTGTTNEWRDGWTIGYTPSLVTGVWAGNNDNSPLAQGADGIYVAAPIWRAYMDQALKNYSVENFPEYKQQDTGKDVLDGKLDATQELKVCQIPGKKKDNYCLASDACPDSLVEKDKFSNNHSILYYVNKDDPQGDPPKDPSTDPQFKTWEKAVADWTKGKKDYSHDSPPTEDCTSKDFSDLGPSVKISSPNDDDNITDSSFTIKANVDSPFNIKKITFDVNGSDVCSGDKDSCNYSVQDGDKGSSLDIKVTAVDENGNDDSDSIKVNVSS
jgi:membrane peptidoglycan carboxypeptidase